MRHVAGSTHYDETKRCAEEARTIGYVELQPILGNSHRLTSSGRDSDAVGERIHSVGGFAYPCQVKKVEGGACVERLCASRKNLSV